jgi:hypothetical protein
MDFALLKEALEALLAARAFGPWSLLGTGLLFGLRLFKAFAPSAWSKLPKWAKLCLPFVLAGGGTFLLGFGSLGLAPALLAAMTAGAAAVGAHHSTKAAGKFAEQKAPELFVPGNAFKNMGLRLLLDSSPKAEIVKLPVRE